jgi:hypothetical protein
MSGLPARFPRNTLINSAAMLESRIQNELATLAVKIEQAEDQGLGTPLRKLAARYNTLNAARRMCTELRQLLWELK